MSLETPFRTAAALVLLAGACIGSIGGGRDLGPAMDLAAPPAGGGAAAPAPDEPRAAPPGEPAAGSPAAVPAPGAAPPGPGEPVMPLRRLTREEYDNVVADLVGDRGPSGRISPGFYLPGEPAGSSGFSTPGLLSEVDLAAFRDAAEGVAERSLARIARILPACPARDDDCIDRFIVEFGARAYRRPLAAREVEALRAHHRQVLRAELGLSFDQSVRALIAAFLQMPGFLYRWELGPQAPLREGALVRLNDHEMASRLSFFVWSSMPDAELFAAAAAGALSTAAGVDAQARRMIASARFAETVRIFAREWLDAAEIASIKKSREVYAAADADNHRAPTALATEVDMFVRRIWVDGDGKLATLLTAPWTYVSDAIAGIYGASASGGGFVKIDLDPTQRPGLLTRAGLLAVGANAYEGDPVKRGRLVREKLLCQPLPPPPADIPPLPPPKPGVGVRERHEDHVLDVGCRSCHRLIDPIGFGLGNFDAIGRFQSAEAGKPIDASGVVAAIDGRDRPFKNVAELVAILAGSDEVRRCVARQWLRFGLRRELVPAEDAVVDEAFAAFARAGFDVRELIVAAVKSRSFRYRAPARGEVLP